MKNLVVILFSIALTLGACKNKHVHHEDKAMETTETVDQTGKEYTSAYVCPMHCEGSGSDAPGECPVCGMEYVMNEKDSHDHDHDGHDHDHEGHDHDHDH